MVVNVGDVVFFPGATAQSEITGDLLTVTAVTANLVTANGVTTTAAIVDNAILHIVRKGGYATGVTSDTTGNNVKPPMDIGRANMDSAMPMAPSAAHQLPFRHDQTGYAANTAHETELLPTSIVLGAAAIDGVVGTTMTNLQLAANSRARNIVKPGDYIAFATNLVANLPTVTEIMQVVEVPTDEEIVVERMVGYAGQRGPGQATPGATAIANGDRLFKVDVQSRNKHATGHSVEVTSPTTMQMIRYGRSTLPMPQVFHTAEHQATEVSNVNTLTRGHCGLEGMGAGLQPRATGTIGAEDFANGVEV
jgi:hypothetical protein